MVKAAHTTLAYLLDAVQVCRNFGHKPLHKCPPLDWFVAHNGRPFTDVRQQWDGAIPIVRGPLGRCFKNATEAVLDNPDRFVYIEGYAVFIIPVHHAWVYDRQTRCCYDPTWEGGGSDYFGVPFNLRYVSRTLLKKQSYGVIDWWEAKWPVLKHSPRYWRAKL